MKRRDKERRRKGEFNLARGGWVISPQLGDTLCKLMGVIWKTAKERRSVMYLFAEEGLRSSTEGNDAAQADADTHKYKCTRIKAARRNTWLDNTVIHHN